MSGSTLPLMAHPSGDGRLLERPAQRKESVARDAFVMPSRYRLGNSRLAAFLDGLGIGRLKGVSCRCTRPAGSPSFRLLLIFTLWKHLLDHDLDGADR